jgi:PPOX class probable F420-dependent enzyme
MSQSTTNPFASLKGQQFINLTTFRKNGTPVPTPVWFAEHDGKLYIVTQANVGKVKRLRNNPQVEIGPSDAKGTPIGPTMVATGRVLPVGEDAHAKLALDRKYGLMKGLFNLMWKLRRSKTVHLEISPGATE